MAQPASRSLLSMCANGTAGTILLLLLISSAVRPQSMNITPSAAAPGRSGSLLLVMNSPAGKAPLALQWRFTFPEGITVDLRDLVAGGAAESAGKSLTCSLSGKPSKSQQT